MLAANAAPSLRSPVANLLSADFFNWRVFQNPNKAFNVVECKDNDSIVGIAVYTLDEKKRCLVHLLDFAKQSFFADYTASVIARLFKQSGSHYVYTWEPLNEMLRQAYASCGLVKNPLEHGPFSYRVPFIVRAQGESLRTVDWFDINAFDLQPLMQD